MRRGFGPGSDVVSEVEPLTARQAVAGTSLDLAASGGHADRRLVSTTAGGLLQFLQSAFDRVLVARSGDLVRVWRPRTSAMASSAESRSGRVK